eukprot:TRINITY_DN3426_c0_g1_i1.p1 TRINITY_DN3426_c0_g1~~TRINITY_DN3426_c0_g1_i1.p1  ORF type:complete len:248 (+),score=88.61 TRINITY_DN3426_c0_g1_i1:118-861(+)
MSEENSKIFLSVHFSSFFLSLLRRESKRNANPFKMAKAGKVKKGGNNRIKRKPGILWQNRKDKKTIKHVEDTFDWVFKKIDKMVEEDDISKGKSRKGVEREKLIALGAIAPKVQGNMKKLIKTAERKKELDRKEEEELKESGEIKWTTKRFLQANQITEEKKYFNKRLGNRRGDSGIGDGTRGINYSKGVWRDGVLTYAPKKKRPDDNKISTKLGISKGGVGKFTSGKGGSGKKGGKPKGGGKKWKK